MKLTPSKKFFVTLRHGKAVATPRNKQVADLAGILGMPASGEVVTIEEMNEAVMDAAAEDDERVARDWRKA